jgi:hypothetical protein
MSDAPDLSSDIPREERGVAQPEGNGDLGRLVYARDAAAAAIRTAGPMRSARTS